MIRPAFRRNVRTSFTLAGDHGSSVFWATQRDEAMLKVTYIDFRDTAAGAGRSGWYITDSNGAMIGDAHRYDSLESGLRALTALCD